MSQSIWTLFPFPTMTPTDIVGGSLFDAHPDCIGCPTRDCLGDVKTPVGESTECRFGITYARLDDSRVLNGIIARDHHIQTKRAGRRMRRERDRTVRKSDLRAAIERARILGPSVVDDHSMRKEALLAELDRNPALHEAIAEQLRKDTSDHLNQGHDFLQLVKLVRGHAEELLHRQFPDLPPHEAANKLATEGAIYFSTSLMLVKMDSLIFLNEVNRALGREVRFQIHPLVLKYVRIYRWQAEQKQLRIHLSGNCHGHSYYNNDAIGAVIQALLDNLVKYAPANSEASVTFHETEDSIVLSFDSLGPRIEPDELTKIFLPQYRAKAARLVELSGLGVGLATAKQISSALNLELDVHQEEIAAPTFPERFSTTFTLRLDRVT